MTKILFILILIISSAFAEWRMFQSKDKVFIYNTKNGAVYAHKSSEGGKSFSPYIFMGEKNDKKNILGAYWDASTSQNSLKNKD